MLFNIVLISLNETINHNLKIGDYVIRQYGNKQVKFTFCFNENGKKLKDILEQSYLNEIRSKQILTGGEKDLQRHKNDDLSNEYFQVFSLL